MKKIIAYLLMLCVLFTACGTPKSENNVADSNKAHFTYEFADAQKGTQLLQSGI